MRKLNEIVVWTSVLLWIGVAAPAALFAATESNMSDEMVQSKIALQLREDGRINWEELRVKVDKGNVTLFGEVASPEEKGWAETIASTVPGVHSVRNDIIVEPALLPDHKIRRDVWEAFKQTPALENNPTVRISVRQAEVTLKGDVLDDRSKNAAEKAAQGVRGVKKVINHLQVVDRLPPKKLEDVEIIR
ncbi:MAG TPA: BON domain-containing protein [Nitrospiraceae bacterium]|nr:BON domain-containing protein [Nitrospiraceae bacterium]